MIWLFPLYLLGAGAILAPILMHLRRRPPQNRVEFSSLMFLEAQTPVPVSKRRLEHWLLLLLRCLVLLLLALMFARPLWRGASQEAAAGHDAIVILLDRSASMRRGDLWQRAAAEVEKAVREAAPEDRVAVATFDDEVQPLWSFEEDAAGSASRPAVVKQRLAEAQAGWGRTNLGRALIQASGWYGGGGTVTAGRRKRMMIISDLQEGTRLDALRGVVWPEDVSVSVARVDAANADNFSLALAASGTEEPTAATQPGAPTAVRVRLANARESKAADFGLAWEKAGGEEIRGYLPPGASRVLVAPPLPGSGSGQILRISGDAWDFDNRIHLAPPQPKKARVVFMGDEKTRDEAAAPLFYLSRALRPTAGIDPELIVIPPDAKTLPPESGLVFASGAAPSATLRPYLEQGGMSVVVVESAAMQGSLRELTGAQDLAVADREPGQDQYLMLGKVDAAHALLRPFADARLRDFTKLRFWKHRRLSLGPEAAKRMEVIAQFDNGDPAIISCRIGKGTLVLLASGWHPADSQLALSTKFVPLLYGWLEAAGFQHDQLAALLVGDAIPTDGAATVMTPDQQSLEVEAGAAVRATLPGFYSVRRNGTDPPTIFAVNLAPEESRVTPMEIDSLREWGLRMESATVPAAEAEMQRERLAASEEESRQRAWLWILAGVLGILASETWLAGRIKTRGEVLASGT